MKRKLLNERACWVFMVKMTLLVSFILVSQTQLSAQHAQLKPTEVNYAVEASTSETYILRSDSNKPKDRTSLLNTFSKSDIRNLEGISSRLIDAFGAEDLSVILDYENRNTGYFTDEHQNIIDSYYSYMEADADMNQTASRFPSNIYMYFDELFINGVSSSFELDDLSGSGFTWDSTTRFSGYPVSIAADSDEAGQNAGQVNTSITTKPFVASLQEDTFVYISHDYRHIAGGSATVEYENGFGEWVILAVWNASNRFANNTLRIPSSEIDLTTRLRFTYDDGGQWGWWWIIDRIAVYANQEAPVFRHSLVASERTNGDYEKVSVIPEGVITQADFDLSVTAVTGVVNTRALTFLFVRGDSPDDEIVHQLGGESQISGAGGWTPWDVPANSNDISGIVELSEAIDMKGLTIWAGHRGFGSTVGIWSGVLEFQGARFDSSYEIIYQQEPLFTLSGTANGIFDDFPDSPIWVAEQFNNDRTQRLKGISTTMINPNRNIGVGSSGAIAGLKVKIFEDVDGQPSGLPGFDEPLISLDMDDLEAHFRLVHIRDTFFTIFVDIENAIDEPFDLEAGLYWLVVTVRQQGLNHDSGGSRSFWTAAEEGLAHGLGFDPGDVFIDVPVDEWGELANPHFAFTVYGSGVSAGSDEITPVPATALSGSVNQQTGEVDLSWISAVSEGFIEPFSGTARALEIYGDLWRVEADHLLWRGNDAETMEIGFAVSEDEYEDFFFEAEMRIEGEGGGTGFMFRSTLNAQQDDIEKGYAILIYRIEGIIHYTVYVQAENDLRIVRSWRSSASFNADVSGSNIISINGNGEVFDIFINGVYEFSFSDSKFAQGHVGLIGGLGIEAGIRSTHDYAALVESPLSSRHNPAMVSKEEFITLERIESSREMNRMIFSRLSRSNVYEAEVNESAGMLSPLLNLGLKAPGSESFVEYEVWRNGSVVGTTTSTSFTDELTESGSYEYEVRAVYGYAEAEFSNSVEISFNPVSIPEDPTQLPAELALSQNYPNPFNPVTQIQYALPEAGEVRLEVYNVNGQRVALLANGQQAAGRHQVSFDGSALSSGVYLYRLQTASGVITRKMMLVK